MRRREFITFLGGTAVAWPFAAWAQQQERMRRIGMLTALADEDAYTKVRLFDYSLSGKWLELLKQVAPRVTLAAVLRDTSSAGVGQFAVIQAVAPSVGLEVSTINVGDPHEIDRAITAFAREPNGGLIVTAAPSTVVQRDLIVTLAARHKLPAVYLDRTPRRRRPYLIRP